MADEIKAVEFQAQVWAIRTLVDGSVNLVLMIPESQVKAAQIILGWHRDLVRVLIEQEDKAEDSKLSYGL